MVIFEKALCPTTAACDPELLLLWQNLKKLNRKLIAEAPTKITSARLTLLAPPGADDSCLGRTIGRCSPRLCVAGKANDRIDDGARCDAEHPGDDA